jgi:hypothetical protein
MMARIGSNNNNITNFLLFQISIHKKPAFGQNKVRADIFSGSLAVFQSEKVAGNWAAIGRRQSPPIIDGNRFEYFRISPANY